MLTFLNLNLIDDHNFDLRLWTLFRHVRSIIAIRLYDQSDQLICVFLLFLKSERPNTLSARNNSNFSKKSNMYKPMTIKFLSQLFYIVHQVMSGQSAIVNSAILYRFRVMSY